jgi:hypothetical protein
MSLTRPAVLLWLAVLFLPALLPAQEVPSGAVPACELPRYLELKGIPAADRTTAQAEEYAKYDVVCSYGLADYFRARASANPALAGPAPATPIRSPRTMSDGYVAGERLGEQAAVGGSFLGGLGGGLLLGLIGTGIAWAAQSPSDLPVSHAIEAQPYGGDYVTGLQSGYAAKTKSRKQGAAIGGGLLGTTIFVFAVLSAGS